MSRHKHEWSLLVTGAYCHVTADSAPYHHSSPWVVVFLRHYTMLASSLSTGSESMAPSSLLVVICSFVAAPSLLYLSILLCTGSRRLSLALTSLAVVLCALDPDDVSRILLLRFEPALGTAVPVTTFPSNNSFLSANAFAIPALEPRTIAGLLTPWNTLSLNVSCLLVLSLYTVVSRPSNNSTSRVSTTTTLSSILQPVLTLLTRRLLPVTRNLFQDIFAFVYGKALPWLATLLLSVLMVLHDLITQAFATPSDLSLPSTNTNKSLPCSFNVNSPISTGSRANLTDEKQKQPMLVAPEPPPRASKVDRRRVAPMSKNKRLFYGEVLWEIPPSRLASHSCWQLPQSR